MENVVVSFSHQNRRGKQINLVFIDIVFYFRNYIQIKYYIVNQSEEEKNNSFDLHVAHLFKRSIN